METDRSIVTYNLSKKYPGTNKFALKGLDLDVHKGEVYGYLGPNGAGKSTTIRLLMNFIQPTAGEAKINGYDSVSESTEAKSQVGYLAGELSLYPKMTGWQFLDYMASLQPPKRTGYRKELARRFKAELNKKISELSKGNRQKVGIIQAFMHEPDILILDEPTSGLDPLMQEEFFALVRETKKRGASLFISSHNLTEVQKMCDKVGFIREGKLIAEQSINDFSDGSVQTYDISFATPAPIDELRRIPHAKIRKNTDHYITIKLRGSLKPLFQILARHKVNSIDRRDLSLEEEFLEFYRGKKV